MNPIECECIYWARVIDVHDVAEIIMHHPRCDKRIKVYQVNDCEWVASTSAKEARRWYLDYMGESINSSDEYCYIEPVEVTDLEMKKLTFFDPYLTLGGDKKNMTFKEALRLMIGNNEDERNFYFATTEI